LEVLNLAQKVTQFLQLYAKDDYAKNSVAPLVATTSLLKNHLYQDLGFKNRVEMGRFMSLHFPKLDALKPKEKLWKKFIYDSIDEIAPACETCDTKESCFGCQFDGYDTQLNNK